MKRKEVYKGIKWSLNSNLIFSIYLGLLISPSSKFIPARQNKQERKLEVVLVKLGRNSKVLCYVKSSLEARLATLSTNSFYIRKAIGYHIKPLEFESLMVWERIW